MKFFRLTKFLPIIAIPLFFLSIPSDAEQVGFEFAMIEQDERGTEFNLDWKKDLEMSKGDAFYFSVKVSKGTVLYLLYEDSVEDMSLLFSSVAPGIASGDRIDIPGRDAVFTISDPPGTEKIYLVAMNAHDRMLAPAIAELADPGKARAAREKILDRLSTLKKEHSSLAKTAEKPVGVAGTSRGATVPEFTEIKGGDFYARTIRIRH